MRRFRSVLLLALVSAVAAVAVLHRRSRAEFVDVEFDDGSAIRLSSGGETRDLLDEAFAILDVAR